MTSKNMTPRKVVALALTWDSIHQTRYMTISADDGTIWQTDLNNCYSWHQLPPLPPREDEGDALDDLNRKLQRECERSLALAKILESRTIELNARISDLRRVREALRKCTDMGGYVLADFAELMTIDAEKMP